MGGRDARRSEGIARKKVIAEAADALRRIEAARSMEALAAAIEAAEPFSKASSALEQALPAARQRCAEMQEQAEKAQQTDFLSRVEEAERRDSKMHRGSAQQLLDKYFGDRFFQEYDHDLNGTWCAAAP